MHGGNRRRKKRPSYGVRTVEITKGHSGFGFTISGQAPCILSCIVPGSPAEKAGLRPGDFLIAVNGQNVSKTPHDDVVRLIGQSKLLKLQIAENYYSDSSDEEFSVNRPKPKYPNRLRHKHQQTRAEKVVRDLQSGAIFSEHAAIHNSENGPLSDRDWAEPYPSTDLFLPPNAPSHQVSINGPTNLHSTPKSSVSPTRLRSEQGRISITETLQVPRLQPLKDEPLPMHPPRLKQVLKKREKILKGMSKFSGSQQKSQKIHVINHEEIQQPKEDIVPLKPEQQQHYNNKIHQQLAQNHQNIQQQTQQLPTSHQQQQQLQKQSTQQINQPQQENRQTNQIHRQQHKQDHQEQVQQEQQQHLQSQEKDHIVHENLSTSQSHLIESQARNESMEDIQKEISVVVNKAQTPLNQQAHQQKQNFQHHHTHSNHPHSHKQLHKVIAMQSLYCSQNQPFRDNCNQSVSSHQHPNIQFRQMKKHLENDPCVKSYQPASQVAHYIRQQQLSRQINKQVVPKLNQSELYNSQLSNAYTSDSSCNGITEQEINNILYPTLAEIQQSQVPREDDGEVVYRAIVGYLGTIEMPKEPQGGSRLTAIRNCIRRLRIEKKVHTLVLMSVLNEQVILTNPHGLTLAEYPAERITFCGVYADDKKFFGLVTAHGSSEDDFSDGSRDDGSNQSTTASSSCHVFMVDPNAIHHPDHCRRAKNFRIDCTPAPAQEDGSSQCLEFPDSADPILHAIMSLYRNKVGFHLDTVAPGLIDVEAQMSPQHSNTSSNSSNSDSGIGFRDEGGHHYHNSDRVFVVEFDDNQRTKLQNVQIIDNLRTGFRENQRNHGTSNNICNLEENSDSSIPSSSLRIGAESNLLPSNLRNDIVKNSRINGHSKSCKGNNFSRTNAMTNIRQTENVRIESSDENLRVSVCDPKKLKELRSTIFDAKKSLVSGRKSATEELETKENLGLQGLISGRECTSPHDGNRLTVRAMPDPVSFERSPGYFSGNELPIQISSMRHSMHKYLQHKQEHLMKVSQKINRRESDSGSVPHVLNTRAFSPAAGKRTPTPSKNCPSHRNLDLTLKLSPKVFGVPFRPSAPSEHSFTRSLEDLRDSSTSDGVSGSMGVGGGSFRDGSESDHGLARLLHASETNLVRCSPTGRYNHDGSRGAFRAVHPRPRKNDQISIPSTVALLPSVSRMSEMNGMRELPCLRNISAVVRHPVDSGDENTETTENTGGQGGSQDVHPPTQDEFSHDSDSEQVDEKKGHGVSVRRLSRSRHSGDERPTPLTSDSNATQSDTEVGKISGPIIRVNNGSMGSSDTPPLEMSRVGTWALSFEKLLEDPAGLHTFAEFLKKEYSHENIYFWTACERYRMLTDEEDRREMAKAIFDRHLGMSASEAVNVDSQARQVAQDGLTNPDEFLFSAAQKQIFNLMKFDSYSRFLKSDLYNTCLTHDRKGLSLPYPGDDTLDPDLGIFFESSFSTHLKKSKSDAEERRRKSLLPWHRKDRSKSKDRGETEYWRKKKLGQRTPSESSSARYDLSDSHTSLSSSDFAPANRTVSKESLTSGEAVSLSGSEGLSLCRFILPDQSNSVLAVKSGETVKELVRQLLDRRRINFTEFNVVLTKGNKVVDLNKDSTVLGGHEVRLERMVLFSLYLPSRKTVIVKAKPHKLVSEVLKPILSKYGLKLDLMVIHKCGEIKPINLKGSVTDLDGEKLIVQTKEEVKEWSEPGRVPKRNTTLDEITNKVFADLLNGKTKSSFDDLGILDFDSRSTKTEPTSETSSIIGSFGRRESLSLERNLPSRQSGNSRGGLLGDNSFGAKRNPNSYNLKTKQENADLYEGLKRAQMYRLDDQRGTEINFELPDFLKSDRGQAATLLSHFDGSFLSNSSEGTEEREFLSRAHPEVWGGVDGGEAPSSPATADNTLIATTDLDLDDLEETLRPIEKERTSASNSSNNNNINNSKNNSDDVKNNNKNNNNNCNKNSISVNGKSDTAVEPPPPYLTPPPPLPPKPKLGGALRGPPPRPPSRQLPSLSHSLHLLDVPIHLTSRPPPTLSDKLSVSFV